MINQLYGAMLNLPIDGNNSFCTGDTGIHIWKITENGNYIIKVNMADHIHGI